MSRFKGRGLHSTISSTGRLILSIEDVQTPEPGPGEVVVHVEAAPLNPSDLLLLFGPADPSLFEPTAIGGRLAAIAPVAAERLGGFARRLDKPIAAGNEGAGRVVAAGAGCQDLEGRTVAFRDASFADYRLLKAAECLVLPEGFGAREAASVSINPMTVLGMVETMKREGHSALVHTAAASNVGQMLMKLCLKDAIPLVNIVRSPAQVDLLRSLGAEHVVDSSQGDFRQNLSACLHATGATLAFDAIGGGGMAATILSEMEQVLGAKMPSYSRYGSSVHKQVYIYGVLDPSPRVLQGNFGMAWGVGGWLMTFFYQGLGPAETARLRDRAIAELSSTFASHYTAEITLEQALDPKILRAYARRATGEKYLITPDAAPEWPVI